MKTDYADCYYCGGVVEEKVQTRELRRDGSLILIENVPMGVCKQCGERYLLPDTAEQIDHLLTHQAEPEKTIQVPVYRFDREVA